MLFVIVNVNIRDVSLRYVEFLTLLSTPRSAAVDLSDQAAYSGV